jgi:hypothetical protein
MTLIKILSATKNKKEQKCLFKKGKIQSMKTAYVGTRRRNILVNEKWTERERKWEEKKADDLFLSAMFTASAS